MRRGYIKLWRKVQDNPVLHERGKRYSRFEAWIYLCLSARGTDDPESGLRRGEFAFSERHLAGAWNWSRGAVSHFFRDLERGPEPMIQKRCKEGESQQKGQQKGQFVSHFIICNYGIYNPSEAGSEASKKASKKAIYKECIKEGSKEMEITESQAAGAAAVDSLPSVESYRLSESLKREISRRDPHSKAARLPDSTRWAPDIDKLMRVDGRAAGDIEAVIVWCQEDPFWGPNILSGRKLREKFDTLWGQMRRPGGKNKSGRKTNGFDEVRKKLGIPAGMAAENGGGGELRAKTADD